MNGASERCARFAAGAAAAPSGAPFDLTPADPTVSISGAMPFLTPLFLQVGLGYSPSRAGLTMVPTVVGAMFIKFFAEPVIDRFGYRRVLVLNTLLLGLFIAGFSMVDRSTPHVAILVYLAFFGVVNSLQFTAMNTLTLGDLDDARASSGRFSSSTASAVLTSAKLL